MYANILSQEYYEEESIRKIYQDVIERLLFTLDEEDEDDDLSKKITEPLVQQDASENVWPPWPWPPWDGDGDDDGGDKKPVPRNRTERAHALAKNVLDFESDIADASLDL